MRDAPISDVGFHTNPSALSIAGPQDERWPAAAVDDSGLRLEVVLTLTGGTKDDC